MSRRSRQHDATPGHDSFLDIVSNIVGILIILVMVTGVRAKNYKADAAPTAPDTELVRRQDQLQSAQQSVSTQRVELVELGRQIEQLETLAQARGRQRDVLATAAEAIRRKVQDRRRQLDAASQRQFDTERRVAAARARLTQLESAKTQIEASRPDTIVLEALPTPLAKTVRGNEAHFQLSGGRITWIPLEQLLDEFKHDAQGKVSQLLSMPELTETVGPHGGFRLRYTLERQELSPEIAMASGGGAYAQLRRWTLIPTSGTLGEPIEEALRQNSRFLRRVASLPRDTTITVWTYQDSFASFREVKKELFALGFATAGRPLAHGIPIGGSPAGSRSAAQ